MSKVSKGGSSGLNKRIVINLMTRTLRAFADEHEVFKFSCLVGKEGHETTPGAYRVLLKDRHHRSRKYNAPMEFALKFSDDWKAIHESEHFGFRDFGRSLGFSSLGTHGCVGLSTDAASQLFDWTPVGTPVVVQRH